MRIGFIGLGNMGRHMAMNVLKGGHQVTVHDLREDAAAAHIERGAAWADSPEQVAAASELVFTSLPGPPEVEAVAVGEHGVIRGLARGGVYVDLSTNSPTAIRRLHEQFKAAGIEMLDAPVSGGSTGAEAAKLAVLVGGDLATYERVKPVLDLIGDKVSYVGPAGAGAVAKLVHNLISISTRMVVAEGLTLGVKAGVDARAVLKAVQDGSFGQGRLIHGTVPDVVMKGDFDHVGFSLALSRKDLRLALDMGREFDVPLKFAAIAEQETTEAMNKGLGDKDSSASFVVQEERSGVQFRG